jgi:hypothetical protein
VGRSRRSGSLYKRGKTWWFSYLAADGERYAESSHSERKGDADTLLRRRVGARDNNLPVVPRAEQLTVNDAFDAVIHDFEVNGKRSIAVVRRRIDKHLLPWAAHGRDHRFRCVRLHFLQAKAGN